MNIHTEIKDDAVIVHLTGDFDIDHSREVRQELASVFQEHKGKRVFLDLGDVRYVDSTGLATLIDALKKSKDMGIELLVTGVKGAIKDLFDLTKLRGIFTVVENPF